MLKLVSSCIKYVTTCLNWFKTFSCSAGETEYCLVEGSDGVYAYFADYNEVMGYVKLDDDKIYVVYVTQLISYL